MMKQRWLGLTLLLTLVLFACATTDPFDTDGKAFAELENRLVKHGKERTTLLFFMVDGKILKEGLIRARVDLTFKIPPGNRWMVVETFYSPRGYWAIGGGVKTYYSAAVLEIEAEQGKRYHIDAKLNDTRTIQISIEDRAGNIVSQKINKKLIPLSDISLRFSYLNRLLRERNERLKAE